MTLTLELPPATERALEQAARRRGVALEEFALDVLAREAQAANATSDGSWDNWLRAIDRLHQHIEAEVKAGRMQPVTADDVTRAIHESRAERERKIDEASGIVLPQEFYSEASHVQ